MSSTKTKRICSRVTPEVLEAMQRTCESNNVSASHVVETAIMTFIANNGDPDDPVVKEIKETRFPEDRTVTVWMPRFLI